LTSYKNKRFYVLTKRLFSKEILNFTDTFPCKIISGAIILITSIEPYLNLPDSGSGILCQNYFPLK